MESSDNDKNPAEEERRQPRWLRTGLAISLLLHLVLVSVVGSFSLRENPDLVSEPARPTVIVSLRRQPGTGPQQGSESSPRADAGEPATAIPAVSPPAPARAVPGPVTSPSASVDITVTTAEDPSTRNSGQSRGPVLDAATLAKSIDQYMQSFSSEQQAQWLQECQRIRNRYFTQNCTLDPATRQGSREIPMDTIVPLLDDDSVAGELARERYALIAGPRNFNLIQTTEQRLLGPTISLLSVGSSGASGGLLSVIQNILVATDVITTPLAVPQFDTQEPAPEADPELVEDAELAEFEKMPPVFPGRG